VHTYSVAVSLAAGQQYTLSVSGQSSQLLWGTPSALAPSISAAVSAAQSASTAVVVVSDDTESEATDRPSLNLPSAQDELIEAVAAANPNTVVVINAGAPVAMPWLSQVAGHDGQHDEGGRGNRHGLLTVRPLAAVAARGLTFPWGIRCGPRGDAAQ
jgi:hypothetical protein